MPSAPRSVQATMPVPVAPSSWRMPLIQHALSAMTNPNSLHFSGGSATCNETMSATLRALHAPAQSQTLWVARSTWFAVSPRARRIGHFALGYVGERQMHLDSAESASEMTRVTGTRVEPTSVRMLDEESSHSRIAA